MENKHSDAIVVLKNLLYDEYGIELVGSSYEAIASIFDQVPNKKDKELLSMIFSALQGLFQDRITDIFEEFAKKYLLAYAEYEKEKLNRYRLETEGLVDAYKEGELDELVADKDVEALQKSSMEAAELMDIVTENLQEIESNEEIGSLRELNEEAEVEMMEKVFSLLQSIEKLLDRGLKILEDIKEKISEEAGMEIVEENELQNNKQYTFSDRTLLDEDTLNEEDQEELMDLTIDENNPLQEQNDFDSSKKKKKKGFLKIL